ncbi:MAG: hypothetical protein EXR99_08965 [Gemmataceae bacterium]|nr:hypothetical protein [Gemmataceae bacterium]
MCLSYRGRLGVVLLLLPFLGQLSATGQELAPFQGSPSCGSASCHNQNLGHGVPRSEYSTWANFDPHHQAFEVLFNERSNRIVKNLYGAPAGSAASAQACLNCHATNPAGKGTGPGFLVSEGVGCESCHGGSGKYLGRHFTSSFLALAPAEREKQFGFLDTKSLSGRARVCSDCHVGNAAKGMEVTHDLIVAGHPRLNFDFAANLAKYPAHWPIEKDLARYPDLQARAWAIGQVEGSRAILNLLQARAQHADASPKNPWPEFSEFNCFACHKDLAPESRKFRLGFGGRHPGSLPWSPWFNGPALKIASGDSQLEQALNKVRKEMETPSPSIRNTLAAIEAALIRAETSSLALEKGGVWTSARMAQKTNELMQMASSRPSANWDDMAQAWLGLAALHNSLNDRDPAFGSSGFTKELRLLRENLKSSFPKGFDSPRQFEENYLDRPGTLKNLTARFEALKRSFSAERRP